MSLISPVENRPKALSGTSFGAGGIRRCLFFIVSFFLLVGLAPALALCASSPAEGPWPEIVEAARGRTVDWFMWGGGPASNTYVTGFVAERMKARFGVIIRQVPVRDIAEVVNKLLVEKQAGKTRNGDADLLWINGENFRTCKRRGLLFGPFAHRLPNRGLVDITRPDVSADFGEPVEDMEAPWGNAQVVFAYDTARTPDPPETFGALIEWIRKHPGRFTYPAPPDFTGSVFVRHAFYHVSDLPPAAWRGSIDESVYRTTARKCFQLLRSIKPDLWRQGRTYPDSQIRMSQLFADGELDFTFGYDPAEPGKRIHDGLYPKTVRTFVFTEGTISNTHFTAIPFNAADPGAAMVTSNFLLSPEAQFQQSDPTVWGTLPVIEIDRLPQPWRRRFNTRPLGPATLPPAVLKQHRLPEPSSEILIRLERGWTRRVLKGR